MELALNRKAKFDYDITEEVVAGIELIGHEVRSAKMGRANLAGSFAVFSTRNNKTEAYVTGMQIPSFQPNNAPKDYDPQRTRRLLLNKSEIMALADKKNEGYSIIPLRLHVHRNFIKLTLAIGRGKKKHDKRATIKKRETAREIDRAVKQQK